MSDPKAPAARRPMSIADATVIASIGSLATIFLGVVQSKVTAVLLGPAGVGELAELRQIVMTAVVPLGVFNGAPFVALLAEAHGRGDDQAAQRVYDVLSTTAIAAGVVIGALVVLVGVQSMPHAGVALALAALGGVVGVWKALPSQALVALHELRTSTIITVVGALVSAALVCWGTYAYGVVGQLATAAAAALVTWPFGMVLARRAHPALRTVPLPRIEWAPLRRALSIGAATMISGFAIQGSLSVVRWALHRSGGVEENGQYQAAWLVGTSYLALILGGLGNVAFPRYAAAPTAAALEGHVEEAGRFVMRIAPPFVLFAIAVRVPIVRILYSGRFDQTSEVLGIMMAGDVSKALSYVQAGPLLYRGHLRTFVVTELVAGAAQAAATLILVPRFGAIGGGWAGTLSYVIYAVVTAFLVEKACDIRVNRWRTLGSVVFAAGAAACVWLTDGRPWLQAALGVAAAVLAYRAGLVRALVERLRRLVGRG
jgi:PST family polysaccharide transporter